MAVSDDADHHWAVLALNGLVEWVPRTIFSLSHSSVRASFSQISVRTSFFDFRVQVSFSHFSVRASFSHFAIQASFSHFSARDSLSHCIVRASLFHFSRVWGAPAARETLQKGWGLRPSRFLDFPGPRGRPDFPNNKFQVPVNVKTLDPTKEQPRCGPCVFLFIFGPCLSY